MDRRYFGAVNPLGQIRLIDARGWGRDIASLEPMQLATTGQLQEYVQH